jgi:arylsulfatase A-like enzyme
MTSSYRFVAPIAFTLLAAGLILDPSEARSADRPARPNVIVILADDIGYGDLSCNGAKRVQTPNCDRLAREGVRFTDGHCSNASCTPSRYSLMTGEYAWRKKGTNILPGDANLIITPGRTTLASLLKGAGYTTAAVGKWHLGLGEGSIDWNKEIKPGPREIGFDYSFLVPATGDRTPCVYVENGRVAGLDPSDPITVSYKQKVGTDPTGKENPELLFNQKPSKGHDMTIVNGISRIGWMTGGKSARWKDEDMADELTRKAVGFIERSKDRPFFLYFATHDIHVPRVPHPRFKGKTNMGPRGDAIVQFDWCVGEVLNTLDRLKLADNTLVVLSSDNGPVIDDGYQDDAVQKLGDHRAAGPYRGGKYSTFEGGTRVPFLVRWPARAKPGVSDALVCQIDLLASLADLTGQKLAADAAPDSFDVLPALLGESKTGRDSLVENGNGLRVGTWKLIAPAMQGPKAAPAKGGKAQLYNLADDIEEMKDLAEKQPQKVAELEAKLKEIRQAGRSRPSS